MVLLGFLINVPSKIERFHQHWEKPWRSCGQKFLPFLLRAYVCEKNLELVSNASFLMLKKKIAEKK